MAQKEIRTTLSSELKEWASSRAKKMGIKESELVRSMLIEEYKKEMRKS